MEIGIQSILWGKTPDLRAMLSTISRLGYRGVEIAQHPAYLVANLGSPQKFSEVLSEYGLTFLGISSGTLDERVEFARQVTPKYIYVENWGRDEEHRFASERNLLFALHTHMFKPVQTLEEAKQRLEEFPRLRFLPDTAHLTVAGEDIFEVLKWGLEKAPAVHLKDWISDYGRSYHFYSEGFVPLGEGSVDLDGAIRFLKQVRYTGWIVVEQDNWARDPEEDARKNLTWLRSRLK